MYFSDQLSILKRMSVWLYNMQFLLQDQLNQLIVISVFDGLVQNSALEIENHALTRVIKEVVPVYLQTRRGILERKSENVSQSGSMKKHYKNNFAYGKENAPFFHKNHNLCYYHATFGAKAYRCSGNDCKNYWMINEISKRDGPTSFQ